MGAFSRLFRWVFSRKPIVININVDAGNESAAGRSVIAALEAYKRATERPVN
jgi:hypothetical protein